MKISTYTVTIGIPAHNEEANIIHLLHDILSQQTSTCHIDKVIVISDASTDKTAQIVSSVKDARIVIDENPTRHGQAYSQNRIFMTSKTDIVILLNADVRIKDPSFVEKIITPIRDGHADLTSCRILPVPPTSLLTRILYDSTTLKQSLYEGYKQGNNLYTCHGRARAFSRRLFQSMRFTQSVGEDAYSYLYCLNAGYRYQYVPETQVFYQLPQTISDHKKQSIRFLQSESPMEKYIPEPLVKKEYAMPLLLKIRYTLMHLLFHPFTGLGYISLYLLMNIISRFVTYDQQIWDISKSSKKISLSP